MTPDDLAERRNWDSAAWRHRDIVLLMDALEQAWAERDEQWAERLAALAESRRMLARAELAEAERDKWHRQALAEQDNHMAWRERAERAERLMQGKNRIIAAKSDALNRVRSLCDDEEEFARRKRRETGVLLWDHPKVDVAEVRDALEGGNQ